MMHKSMHKTVIPQTKSTGKFTSLHTTQVAANPYWEFVKNIQPSKIEDLNLTAPLEAEPVHHRHITLHYIGLRDLCKQGAAQKEP